MGLSCEYNADIVLRAISEKCFQQTGLSNVWKHKDKRFFWEVGRENQDGSITGSISELVGDGKNDKYYYELDLSKY